MIKRNRASFPESFRFQLTESERDQVVANCDNLHTLKFNPSLPYVFTEQGIAQLSSVLHSPIAIDDSVLVILDKRKEGVSAQIYTRSVTPQLALDTSRHDTQYPPINVCEFQNTHDRFLCIDDTVYHIGASLKDLGKKWFALNRLEVSTSDLIKKI